MTARSNFEPNTSGQHRLVFSPELDRVPHGVALWQSACTIPNARREALHRALHRAIQTELTTKQREVIELFFFDGLSQGQIALRLGISQQVVQRRIYGARRQGRLVGGAIARLRNVLAPFFSAPSSCDKPARSLRDPLYP